MNIQEIEKYIKDNREVILKKCADILGRSEMTEQSFNGIIGGKNKTFGLKVTNYNSSEEYVDAWMNAERRIKDNDNANYENSIKRIDKLLGNAEVRKYIETYLARTFLKRKAD